MSVHLELVAKFGAVAIGALSLIGGAVVGAARLSVASVEAQVEANRAATDLRMRVVEDALLDGRSSWRRIEGKVDDTRSGLDILRRAFLERGYRPGPFPGIAPDPFTPPTPLAQESLP